MEPALRAKWPGPAEGTQDFGESCDGGCMDYCVLCAIPLSGKIEPVFYAYPSINSMGTWLNVNCATEAAGT